MSIHDLKVPDLTDGSLHCPGDENTVCGMQSVHWHGRVERLEGSYRPEESARLPFWCENGHEFDLVLEQYKGDTFVRVEPRPDRIVRQQQVQFTNGA